jgi:chemotaxis protein MotB
LINELDKVKIDGVFSLAQYLVRNRLLSKRLLEQEDKEEEEKSDRYLLTYSDLITLLLGLFVILYASAQVDESKYAEMSRAFSQVFHTQDKATSQGDGILTGSKDGVPFTVISKIKTKSLDEVKARAEQILNKFVQESGLKIQKNGETVSLILPEVLLFNSGKADIQAKAAPLLDSLASLLSGAELLIAVDGHSDSQPIRSFRYESNWHLSTARALNVAYSLIGKGAPEQNIIVRGFGAQRPIGDNSTEEGKQKNRRVEIVLSPLPSDAPSINGYNSQDSLKL